MNGSLPFFIVDVFTSQPFSGNPLAIVMDAGGLTGRQMQIIARQFNLSETIFVMPPEDPRNSARVRIFFPVAEIPFAGHPTIGCAIHLAGAMTQGDGDFETLVTLEEAAGLVPVEVSRRDGAWHARFTAPVIPAPHPGTPPDAALAAMALGLEAAQIGFAAHSPTAHAGGPAFLYIPVRNLEALGSASPREPHWSAMLEAAGVDSAYLYAPLEGQGGFRARMFSPNAGIPEDPATGSATAILARQLLEAGELAEGTNCFGMEQGVEMGRPSKLGLEIDVDQGMIAAVRVSGSSVSVASGTIRIP